MSMKLDGGPPVLGQGALPSDGSPAGFSTAKAAPEKHLNRLHLHQAIPETARRLLLAAGQLDSEPNGPCLPHQAKPGTGLMASHYQADQRFARGNTPQHPTAGSIQSQGRHGEAARASGKPSTEELVHQEQPTGLNGLRLGPRQTSTAPGQRVPQSGARIELSHVRHGERSRGHETLRQTAQSPAPTHSPAPSSGFIKEEAHPQDLADAQPRESGFRASRLQNKTEVATQKANSDLQQKRSIPAETQAHSSTEKETIPFEPRQAAAGNPLAKHPLNHHLFATAPASASANLPTADHAQQATQAETLQLPTPAANTSPFPPIQPVNEHPVRQAIASHVSTALIAISALGRLRRRKSDEETSEKQASTAEGRPSALQFWYTRPVTYRRKCRRVDGCVMKAGDSSFCDKCLKAEW